MDKRLADELVTCKCPDCYGGKYGWYKWTSRICRPRNDDLSPEVWDRLPVDPSQHADMPEWWKYYTSREDAVAALASAVRSLL